MGRKRKCKRNQNDDGNDDAIYEVEAIVGEVRRGRQRCFVVKWKGYDDTTVEPIENLVGCEKLLEDYLNGAAQQPPEDNDGDGAAQQPPEDDGDDYQEEGKTDDPITSGGEPPGLLTSRIGDSHADRQPRSRALFGTSNKKRKTKTKPTAKDYERLESDGDDDDAIESECVDMIVIADQTTEDVGQEETPEEIEEVAGPHFGISEQMLRDMAVSGWEKIKLTGKQKTSRTKVWSPEGRIDPRDPSLAGEDNLYEQPPTLSPSAMIAAISMKPVDLFFYFLSKKFWRGVQCETNRYEFQTRSKRKEAIFSPGSRTPSPRSSNPVATSTDAVDAFVPIQVSEIMHFLALLISRTISPMNTRLADHWKSAQRGVVACGTWSRVMSKKRFMEINRFLHFTNNEDPRASQDRAWKIRSVIDELQRSFKLGMEMGRWLAFDEMVIPSRSSRNKIRVYLKNKPHKYGTKLFALCCGETHYCKRVEVYCGVKKGVQMVDTKSGAVAVVRNLKAVYKMSQIDPQKRRIVVTDREYTSIPLALRLLDMGYYTVGTIMTSRIAYPDSMKFKFKQRIPSNVQRGHYKLSRNKTTPLMKLCSWVDSKPVHFLSTGMSAQQSVILRKQKDGTRQAIVCPQLVKDYNNYMSGVDSHDQLRLQRYSIQRQIRCQKYYKTLFYGLLDMAIVNALIVHRLHARNIQERPLSHSEFLIQLHEELLLLKDEDFEEAEPELEVVPLRSPSSREKMPPAYKIANTEHILIKSEDKKESGQYKYRNCKVCSVLRSDSDADTIRVNTTRFYCRECSTEKGKIYLCNTTRRVEDGNSVSCFNIWHAMWKNGREVPSNSIRRRQTKEDANKQRSLSVATVSSTASTVYF